MALITDPDSLNQATEIVIDTGAKTVQLLVAGNLSTDGVTGQALYSFLKEEWKDDATKIPFSFPMEAITPEQFEFLDGWAPADATTRNLVRNAGWAERNSSGNIIAMYAGIISLGTLGGSDQPYYDNAGAVVNFTYAGPINEAVQILDDPNGDGSYGDGFDRRTTLHVYAREQAKIYAISELAAIGVTSMTYQAYRFPLANSADLKVVASDVTVDAYDIDITVLDNVDRGSWANSTSYAAGDFVLSVGRYYSTVAGGTSSGTGVADDVGVTWVAYAGERDIGGTYYPFGIIIDGDATANGSNHTAQEIYQNVQSALRKATDIDADADTLIGQLSPQLLQYVGDTLKTNFVVNPQGGGGGVFIDNFDTNDTNSITFQDNSGTERQFPFVSAGSINFNTNLQSDATSEFWMFFTTNPAGDFGTVSAVLVDDNGGTDIAGLISAATSIAFDFDYDGNVQGGRTAGTDADVTLVAIGTDGAQHVVATGTITRTTGLSFTLTSALERNYLNP